MTTLEVLNTVWLVVLTVLLLGVSRHVALELATLKGTGRPSEALLAGMPIATRARRVFQDLERRRAGSEGGLVADHGAPRYVVWLSSTCSSCMAAAASLGKASDSARYRKLLPRITAVLVSGAGPSVAEMKTVLAPVADRLILDPQASALATELHLLVTPFALATDEGYEKVLGWTDLAEMDKLDRLDETFRTPADDRSRPAPVALGSVARPDGHEGHEPLRESVGMEDRA